MGRIEEHAPEEDLVHLDQCGKGRIDANAKPSKVLPAKGNNDDNNDNNNGPRFEGPVLKGTAVLMMIVVVVVSS